MEALSPFKSATRQPPLLSEAADVKKRSYGVESKRWRRSRLLQIIGLCRGESATRVSREDRRRQYLLYFWECVHTHTPQLRPLCFDSTQVQCVTLGPRVASGIAFR